MSTAMKKTKKNSGGSPSVVPDEVRIAELAKLSHLAYGKYRHEEAKKLGITVDLLDQLVKAKRATRAEDEQGLPHWKVEPWGEKIDGASLLDDIEKVFRRHIVLPEGAGVALALWVLHAWTFDAGDISPYLLLVSPEKRCGKTSVLILLSYLTPKAELASNISPSAVYRYVQDVRPTLLIDEADSFLKENEEMRGILNSGHTKVAANVLRNVERNGEHKTKRFSCWAPKAIAGIKALADTLEDRSIVVLLQRKTKTASVERLRRHDSDELAMLRRRTARWAEDYFSKLTDPDPDVPDTLNDRAADNWRPLFAIADLAGGRWPQRARDAGCVLSGEGHDMSSIGIELLASCREAFGDEHDALRSSDLVVQLTRDSERPWAGWNHGKPLTQRQLAGLLRPFSIISETVSIPGLADAKGYRRARFEEAWRVYLPGQNPSPRPPRSSDPSKRRNADDAGVSGIFHPSPMPPATDRKMAICPTAMQVPTLRRIKPPETAEETVLTRNRPRWRPPSRATAGAAVPASNAVVRWTARNVWSWSEARRLASTRSASLSTGRRVGLLGQSLRRCPPTACRSPLAATSRRHPSRPWHVGPQGNASVLNAVSRSSPKT
jgi:putative DNA primase/helicase